MTQTTIYNLQMDIKEQTSTNIWTRIENGMKLEVRTIEKCRQNANIFLIFPILH